ncbi:hypothetical protein [Hoylesella oralis]|uniref:hypothetical protein n=1 Tax=Hoylesella oralis TaxID=28134 RepID=UPI0028E56662|nr:hypothetical protein [Hoylesella oralis]
MKKILSAILLLMASVALHAQNDVTKFLGIPVDGSKASMIQKLKGKGFVYNSVQDCLEGEFNGTPVYVSVVTNNNKVWRILLLDKTSRDEAQIKIRFNRLCDQFENNAKYVSLSKSDNILPESEDISYEMTVHKKQYEAVYYQLPDDSNLTKRLVWFKINVHYSEYYIAMFYDNEFNHSNGEDL